MGRLPAPRARRLRVLGVDLATEPRATGAVVLVAGTDGDGATLEVVDGVLDDDRLVALATEADVVGLDAPLGWPDAFVDAIAWHHTFERWPEADDPVAQRRLLSKRETDRVVKRETGLDALSVSADRIGAVAMRAARLQTRFADTWGEAGGRDGSGRIVETYPAAALQHWGLRFRAYKGADRAALRRAILDGLRAAAPWLALDAVVDRCCASDHDLDAVICALIALATVRHATRRPATAAETDVASREGWIHVPTVSLAGLGALLGDRPG